MKSQNQNITTKELTNFIKIKNIILLLIKSEVKDNKIKI